MILKWFGIFLILSAVVMAVCSLIIREVLLAESMKALALIAILLGMKWLYNNQAPEKDFSR